MLKVYNKFVIHQDNFYTKFCNFYLIFVTFIMFYLTYVRKKRVDYIYIPDGLIARTDYE